MSIRRSGFITLSSDFGLQDEYVGVMKGVIAKINPSARIIDLSHAIEAHNLLWPNYLIYKNYAFFPKGTIHALVVDPGVGTSRGIIVLKADNHFFVCPDNGLITRIYQKKTVQKIIFSDNPQYWLPRVSNTFHGRDIFAPVAAHLSLGEPLDNLGREVKNITTIPIPVPEIQAGAVRGTIIHIDHFGNLLTNIEVEHIRKLSLQPTEITVKIEGRTINGLQTAYGSVAPGELLAIIGSRQLLEISVNQGSAAVLTKAVLNSSVSLSTPPE